MVGIFHGKALNNQRVSSKKTQQKHGSLNVPIAHHPTIRYMVYNGYYKVMSNIPKMGQLPTPEKWDGKNSSKCFVGSSKIPLRPSIISIAVEIPTVLCAWVVPIHKPTLAQRTSENWNTILHGWATIRLFNSSPWKDPPMLLIGKPSISIRAIDIPWLC